MALQPQSTPLLSRAAYDCRIYARPSCPRAAGRLEIVSHTRHLQRRYGGRMNCHRTCARRPHHICLWPQLGGRANGTWRGGGEVSRSAAARRGPLDLRTQSVQQICRATSASWPAVAAQLRSMKRHCCARRAQQAEPPPVAQPQRVAIRRAPMRAACGTVPSQVDAWGAVGCPVAQPQRVTIRRSPRRVACGTVPSQVDA